MESGVWHQLGANSQKITIEQLKNNNGVGVIISPKDLNKKKAIEYTDEYQSLNASILLDLQFYEPEYQHKNLTTYGLDSYRLPLSDLKKMPSINMASLSKDITELNKEVGSSAIIAPAMVYEPGNSELYNINEQLFSAAKLAGENLGLPVYATIVLGNGFAKSTELLEEALGQATNLKADGWYFACEVNSGAIPSDMEEVEFICNAILTLAGTGVPLIHAFAGPSGLLSLACGSRSIAIGQHKTLWSFSRSRFQESGRSGGQKIPSRYFSDKLWSTIVLPDESTQISSSIWGKIKSSSPFHPISQNDESWLGNQKHNHLLYVLGNFYSSILKNSSQSICEDMVVHLKNADEIYKEIAEVLGVVKDNADSHQIVWAKALEQINADRSDDFNFLEN